ncbi:hypothetical protein DRU43_21380 [Salmonella enterica subsp. enterica]|uniref:Uncharacterized protein n=1 Tax=Salmonella enterica subsp. enterica serovar Cardoner TaxID=2564309 RepID=A0A5V6PXS4_SALET|nr:hypothetical protein [Salmonella enterica]EAB9927549.1 hypothetical protein [Salmonella enterica subsp. enterica serovar Kua]EBF2919774.1 hypothetical protein [Salmonella enterica subsp. enterica serovar Agama]EBU8205214.1 hypothetical protein [Salmonella enterica subsp. enterica serovar Cardoner]EBW2266359.1 hypothetical protein [Salmonella enterica subsp. enterica serovar Hillingdon]EBW2325860.1 hypothetical protein [Salmonella enterica subsp. enterica serovar Agoueve]ECG1223015.1 hypoth
MNVACDGPSGRGPWMGRVIRSQHISNLKYEGYMSDGKSVPVSRVMAPEGLRRFLLSRAPGPVA